jgi:AcrR family transcriptional regulator
VVALTVPGRARVARATVYQHFSDKQDILVALSDRIARRIMDTVDSWPPLPVSPDPGEHELRTMIDSRVSQILGAIAANADATRLIARLTRGSDRLFVHDMLWRIDEHVVAVLTNEIRAATGREHVARRQAGEQIEHAGAVRADAMRLDLRDALARERERRVKEERDERDRAHAAGRPRPERVPGPHERGRRRHADGGIEARRATPPRE